MNAFDSKIEYLSHLPKLSQLPSLFELPGQNQFLLIYDQELEKNPLVSEWVKHFNYRYPVTSGENLKDIEAFPQHMSQLYKKAEGLSHRQLTIIAMGGGSVGDFSGFVASIYKRGVPIVHIPTTWLAAIDSSHGGKTALNLGGIKNQLGTYYPAKAILIIKEVFNSLDEMQCLAASGELIKIGIINSPSILKEIDNSKVVRSETLWRLLPQAIAGKMQIVLVDPFEKKNLRQQLNLGHTLGHIYESYNHWPHGFAVAQGLYFSLNWSRHLKWISEDDYNFMVKVLDLHFKEKCDPNGRTMTPIPLSTFIELLKADKKSLDSKNLHFIFVESLGKVRVEAVSAEALVSEAKRQKVVN